MEVGLVRSIDIDKEMQQAYLDYAMSVIVARALPDARDGLKPVHRRILYAMHELLLRPDSAYKKSARIVGEVLGKFHPHGDMAVYESMARMAQDFSMRYLLVDGQGNFGSVDGDPPAAMRYTEARLAAPAIDMLADIQRNTVDFSDNFDGTLREPIVLPSALPNLLVNGATGIAVGMSTSIPPHNLGEVVDALIFMLQNWEKLDDINIDDLMRFIQGPDFPTGGVILPSMEGDDLKAAYGSGRGRVTVQARAHAEEMSRGRNRIIVTELPYMTNKASLIERIAELVREGRLEGIADLRDESDRQGLRIVIELTKTAVPEAVLQDLYKTTPMRVTFGIIMLALVDGEPRLLSLKQSLRVYLDHRLVVIRRRSEFDLEKARQRAHILEGLRIALKHLDEVIDLIRKSPDVDTARARLIKRFKLSDIQAQSILDLPLRRLAALERKKIEDEYKEVIALIKSLEDLLHSPLKMRQEVAMELQKVKEAYGDRRRTFIAGSKGDKTTSIQSLVPDHTVWVVASAEGLVARTLDDKSPRLSGNAAPAWLVQANTQDTLFLISDQGEAAGIPVHALPELENVDEGVPFYKVSPLTENDHLAGIFTLPSKEDRAPDWYVLTASRLGMVKKTSLPELPGPSAKTFSLMKINPGDAFGWVRLTDGKSQIILASTDGLTIRFSEEEIRPMGLVAAGVNGIKLQGQDKLVGMDIISDQDEVLLIASDGKAKRIPARQFPTQGRYGQGVIAWKLPRTSSLAGMAVGKTTLRLTIRLDKLAPKAIRLDEAAAQSRAASGKALLPLKPADRLVGLTIPWETPRPSSQLGAQPQDKPSPARVPKSKQPLKKASPFTIRKAVAVKPKVGTPTQVKPATKPDSTASQMDIIPSAGKLLVSIPEQARSTPAKPKPVAAGKKSPPVKTAAQKSTAKTKATQLTLGVELEKPLPKTKRVVKKTNSQTATKKATAQPATKKSATQPVTKKTAAQRAHQSVTKKTATQPARQPPVQKGPARPPATRKSPLEKSPQRKTPGGSQPAVKKPARPSR